MKEREFFDTITEIYKEWTLVYQIPEADDDFGIIEMLSEFYDGFLSIDGEQVEQHFKLKYNLSLIDYLFTHYNKDNLIYFLMFIIHFVIENKVDLFFSGCKCTGVHFGHWATANLKETHIGKIVQKRLLSHFFKGRYVDFYKKKFQHANEKIEEKLSEQILSVQIRRRKLVDLIVDVSGATIFLSALKNIAQSRFKVWKNVDDSTQFMYTMSTVPGSIKLYGFCMEKTKASPTTSSNYTSINPHYAPEHIKDVLLRSDYFIDYFIKYIDHAEDLEKILFIAKKNKLKVWYHFQLVFWLITQKFENKKEDSWKDFFYFKNVENRMSREGFEYQLESKERLDRDFLELYRLSDRIMTDNFDYIHKSNRNLFQKINAKIKSM